MRENNSATGATLTDTQVAARRNLTTLKIREARGERVAQSAVSEAIRRLAEADYEAQHTKTWAPTR
jgi:hypothetical protein